MPAARAVLTAIEDHAERAGMEVPEAFVERGAEVTVIELKEHVLPAVLDGEMAAFKEIVTFCKTSMRGHEAHLTLKGEGFRNVKFMDGGVAAWPYELAKGAPGAPLPVIRIHLERSAVSP